MTAVEQRVVTFALGGKKMPLGLMPAHANNPAMRTIISGPNSSKNTKGDTVNNKMQKYSQIDQYHGEVLFAAGNRSPAQSVNQLVDMQTGGATGAPVNASQVTFAASGSCCVPTGCKAPLPTDDLSNVVHVVCSNTECPAGEYMHRECFEQWQNMLLSTLNHSNGAARNWSDKQRRQNIWTNKGYNLVFRMCDCKCGKGRIRKDLDWVPPSADDRKKRGRKKKQNEKPALVSSASASVQPAAQVVIVATRVSSTGTAPNRQLGQLMGQTHHHHQHQHHHHQHQHYQVTNQDRMRSPSISSTGSAGCSPPTTPDQFASPIPRSNVNPFYNGDRSGNYENLNPQSQQEVRLFTRRQDYSAFNCLPRTKINPYMIKVEDDNRSDEIRTYILTTLAQQRTTQLPCCLCHSPMVVFDRFPIVNGLMFLSPLQYSPGSVSMASGKRGANGVVQTQYLNGVCMVCLDGDWQELRCKSCNQRWAGNLHILGDMYTYDVFAAQPCCEDRLRCNRCQHIIMPLYNPEKQYYFSDWSHDMACPKCKAVDYHFVKPLNAIYNYN